MHFNNNSKNSKQHRKYYSYNATNALQFGIVYMTIYAQIGLRHKVLNDT